GLLGKETFAARYEDEVKVRVELSQPAYGYLIGFNFDGKEQPLWPVGKDGQPDPKRAPGKTQWFSYPPKGETFHLNDDDKGGLQAFVAVASRQPLLAYEAWRRKRGAVGWKRLEPGSDVWQGDVEGVYPVVPGRGAERGRQKPPRGAPPLREL